MTINKHFFQTSIGKKQIVATTGLMLILFVVGHLAGNLFIFFGADAFNAYAKKLSSLRPALYVIEVGLLFVFLIHIYFTAKIVLENIQARNVTYSQFKSRGQRSLATRIMPFTGSLILIFVIVHLLDFTFVDKHGPLSEIDGVSYGLYGVVYNSFLDLGHVLFYVAAMCSLGFHLSHGVQSFMQTYGFNHPKYTPKIKNISFFFGLFIAVAFSSIPVCIYMGCLKG